MSVLASGMILSAAVFGILTGGFRSWSAYLTLLLGLLLLGVWVWELVRSRRRRDAGLRTMRRRPR